MRFIQLLAFLVFTPMVYAESYSCAFLSYVTNEPTSVVYTRRGETFVSGDSYEQEWDIDENEFFLLLTRKGVQGNDAFSSAGAFVFVRIINKINLQYFHSAVTTNAYDIERKVGSCLRIA